MSEETWTLDTALTDLPKAEWLTAVGEIALDDGYLHQLDPRHHAIFIEDSSTLLVSFETMQGIPALSDMAQPLGWNMVKEHRWSHLCLLADGDTWFRSRAVYAYFDRLIDDGFFDEFEQVLFYGAGPCAYAAAAYSVAAPGARVLSIQPQATLDPRVAEWDDRFADMRRVDFTSRYGYAPDMLEAADAAYVIYDPREQLDAVHAALFTRPNVEKFRMRYMGEALQTDILEMGIWEELLSAAMEGELSTRYFALLYRARRDHRPYLRNMVKRIEQADRPLLGTWLCSNVTSRMRARAFSAKLTHFENLLEERRVNLPPSRQAG